MKKQSSIEWFYNKIKNKKIGNGQILLDIDTLIEEFEQAKAMHEMEIIRAHFTAQPFSATMLHNAEQYYNLTFNQDAREQK